MPASVREYFGISPRKGSLSTVSWSSFPALHMRVEGLVVHILIGDVYGTVFNHNIRPLPYISVIVHNLSTVGSIQAIGQFEAPPAATS